MSTANIPWGALEHAFGPASDLPALLRAVSQARGNELQKRMCELCERVLHQGSIYSASSGAVRELIAISAQRRGTDKIVFYAALDAFADSAREAIGTGVGRCCAGHPADGEAILAELRAARDQFAADLPDAASDIRRFAASLLTAPANADAATIRLVRDRFFTEQDGAVRGHLIKGLSRVRGEGWREFLSAALAKETAPANRCALLRAETYEWKSETPAATVDELIAASLQAEDWELLGALEQLGAERETDALFTTFAAATDRDLLREISRRLLCLAFNDRRDGWSQIDYSFLREASPREAKKAMPATARADAMFRAAFKLLLLALLGKIFPWVVRWKLKRAMKAGKDRARKVDYWGIRGAAPDLPAKLTALQQRILRAAADKSELWRDSTNLWALFGLPADAVALRRFADDQA